MSNADAEIQKILTEAIHDSEIIVSDIKKKQVNHFLHIETPDVVEILNATSL